MPHTPLPPSLGWGGWSPNCFLAFIWPFGVGGGHRSRLHPRPASSLAIMGTGAAPWKAVSCKQHISASERRKVKEKERQTCRETRTTCQHEEQTGPWTKCGLSYGGKEWALSVLFADSEIAPATDAEIRSAAAGLLPTAQQGLPRAGTTKDHFLGCFWNLLGPGELGACCQHSLITNQPSCS